MKKSTANLIFIILTIIAGMALAVLTSCKAVKTLQKEFKDSTVVAKVDSGSVTKNEKTSENLQTWYKETFTLQPIITNNDTTITKYITITKEGGTKIINNKETILDSSWKKSFDSLRLQIKTKDVKTKVEILPLWQVFGLCVLAFLLLWLLQNLSIKSTLKKFTNEKN
jgi:hypothetical protein